MFKHLLVCVDGSRDAAAAEDLALALAPPLEAAIHGVHVVDASFLEGAFISDISGAMGFEPFLNLQAQVRATLFELAEAIKERFSQRCAEAGFEGTFQIVRAPVVKGILEAAKLADLLVVGQRGVNARLHEDLLGPTTEALLHRSPRPVLVVPPESSLPTQPLVAYDGSPKSVRALDVGARMCRQLGLELTVVTVSEDPDRAQTRLREAAEYLQPHGVAVRYRQEKGEAVEKTLLSLLTDEGFDLLLLGAHGHSRVVELVLGSTSEFLARRAPVPVLCVTRA